MRVDLGTQETSGFAVGTDFVSRQLCQIREVQNQLNTGISALHVLLEQVVAHLGDLVAGQQQLLGQGKRVEAATLIARDAILQASAVLEDAASAVREDTRTRRAEVPAAI